MGMEISLTDIESYDLGNPFDFSHNITCADFPVKTD